MTDFHIWRRPLQLFVRRVGSWGRSEDKESRHGEKHSLSTIACFLSQKKARAPAAAARPAMATRKLRFVASAPTGEVREEGKEGVWRRPPHRTVLCAICVQGTRGARSAAPRPVSHRLPSCAAACRRPKAGALVPTPTPFTSGPQPPGVRPRHARRQVVRLAECTVS